MTRAGFYCLLVCLGALGTQPARAGGKALPADLAFVPPDAVGFVHVRLADAWKSEHFKEWRDTVLKAGPKYLAAFDARFSPKPSTLDRVTFVFARPRDEGNFSGEDDIFAIVTMTEAIDKAAFRKNTIPGATEEKTDAGTLLIDAKMKFGVHFLNDRTLVVGPTSAMRKVLARPRAAKGNLSDAIKTANSGKPIVMALNPQALPQRDFPPLPPPFQPLLKAQSAVLAIDFQGDGHVHARLAYANADQTDEAETAAKGALAMARVFIEKTRGEMQKKVLGNGKPGSLDDFPEAAGSLFVVGIMNRLDEYLDASPLKKEGNALAMSMKFPPGTQGLFSVYLTGMGLMVPAVQKVRDAASRTQGSNNLKQMILAMHNHHDTYKKLPAAAMCDKAGKPLLSWRVAILPFIDQDNLYRKFKLDEPWDSENNKALIPLMPTVYQIPGTKTIAGHTHYRVFVGGGAGFELSKGLRFADFTDGLSNTIAIVEAAESVTWTRPEELVYDAKKPLPKFGDFHGNGIFQVALFDGTVRMIRLVDQPEATLRALITRAGND